MNIICLVSRTKLLLINLVFVSRLIKTAKNYCIQLVNMPVLVAKIASYS